MFTSLVIAAKPFAPCSFVASWGALGRRRSSGGSSAGVPERRIAGVARGSSGRERREVRSLRGAGSRRPLLPRRPSGPTRMHRTYSPGLATPDEAVAIDVAAHQGTSVLETVVTVALKRGGSLKPVASGVEASVIRGSQAKIGSVLGTQPCLLRWKCARSGEMEMDRFEP